MPRNSSGVYSPPSGTAAVAGNALDPVAFNTLITDIGNELTASLPVAGEAPMAAPLTLSGNATSALHAVPLQQLNGFVAGNANIGPLAIGAANVQANVLTPAQLAYGAWTTVPSASTVDLGAQTSRNIILTGTTPISSFGSTATPDNIPFFAVLNGAITITNGANLKTPGGVSYAGSPGDLLCIVQTSSGVWSVAVLPASGLPPVTAPIFGIPAAVGLKITNNAGTPNTKIDVSAAYLSAANTSSALVSTQNFALTIDLTTTGAGGMDSGSRPTSGWVYLWAISNGTTFSAIASVSSTSPTLPTGYTYKVYIGAMRCDGSQNLLRTLQYGNRTQYVVTASTNTSVIPLMVSGALGSWGAVSSTYVAQSVSAFVPSTASHIKVSTFMYYLQGAGTSNNNVSVAPNASFTGPKGTNPPPLVADNSAALNVASSEILLESTNIYIAIGGTGGAVGCLGWTDRNVLAA